MNGVINSSSNERNDTQQKIEDKYPQIVYVVCVISIVLKQLDDIVMSIFSWSIILENSFLG